VKSSLASSEHVKERNESLFFNCMSSMTNRSVHFRTKPQPVCNYFNVEHFFHDRNGLGYNYRNIALNYKQKTLFRDLRFYHLVCDRKGEESTSSAVLPSRISYIHIHKNGGSTIREAFYNLYNTSTKCEKVIIFESQEIKKYQVSKQRLMQTTQKITANAHSRQQRGDKSSHVVLSFVREPVSRFLSSVS